MGITDNGYLVICYKFKKYLFDVWFYTIFFMILYMYIVPGQRLTTPWERNFDVNKNILSLWSFVASLKKNLIEVWFYTFFFHDLMHVYSPGAGTGSPQGTKFGLQQKGLITLPICCKFQRNLFEVLILCNFFHYLYMYIAPRQIAYSSPGTKFWCQQKLLDNSVICC